MLALDDFESADSAADVDADLLGDLSGDLEPASSTCANSDAAMANWMKRPIFLISFFSIQRAGIEPLHFAGDPAVESRSIELRDAADAAPASFSALPGLFGAGADRGTAGLHR